ncbi:MAG: M1 family metallopeptidase [Balneolaceae bacterium]
MQFYCRILILTSLLQLSGAVVQVDAQPKGYWQQEAEYVMEVDLDVESHRLSGSQQLTYHNNSPDTLNRVFYHLYFNAFQPNSMMDQRSRTIADPDSRIGDRIYHLSESEIGYQKILTLSQDGEPLNWKINGTVMEVELAEPIPPGAVVHFEMEFEAQVPVQVRRSGRHNSEGIDYSMSQWYPKIAEYDHLGWHANPYISREFHGVFGTFDVTIHIDRNYIVAATGYLQNPEEVGYGYEEEGSEVQRPDGEKLTWHFKSDYQHDFMWAADPDYRHVTAQVPGGPLLRFFYQSDPVAENSSEQRQAELLQNWERLPEAAVGAFLYMNEHFGEYPYDEYMVIQGGDGGMEYIMGTLITGNRSLNSLVSVTVHELVHAWFQGVLANNESLYHWMDEGFTSYASARVMHYLYGSEGEDPFDNRFQSYFRVVELGLEEPMVTHADHFHTNSAYSAASYTKGMIFLHQLSYIIGQDAFDRGMLRFFEEWKFKHPSGLDFVRVMERESGMELYWYYEYWVLTTKTVDYAVEDVEASGPSASVNLVRHGLMPMPLDIEVELEDGRIRHYYIPLRIMWGEKESEYQDVPRTVLDEWLWVTPAYRFELPYSIGEIVRLEIDPTRRMADVNRENNVWPRDQE